MKFTVIMPSLLADYPHAATNRDKKLIRAINSVCAQTFTDFELIIIADGCALTEYIVNKQAFRTDERIKLLSVERKQLWSNTPRNTGIDNAAGDYIIYVDSDDKYGPDHLKNISDQIAGEDWVYANDWVWNGTAFVERKCDVTQYGRCGTSNICHAARLNLRWEQAGYGHDYHFIQQLLKYPNHKEVTGGQYHVCR
jgi:glycosyltransferase involved in cell wall biosynthesis